MIDFVIEFVKQQFQQNEFFSAGISVTIFTAILYQARALPSKLWLFIKMVTTTKINFNNENKKAFDLLLIYLQKNKPLIRQSKFNAIFTWGNQTDIDAQIGIGYGVHFYRIGKYLCRIYFYVDKDSSSLEKPIERLELTVLSRSKDCKDNLFKHILDKTYNPDDSKSIDVYVSSPYGWECQPIPKRPLDTVFIDSSVKAKLCQQVQMFLDSKEWSHSRGLPWRYSVILDGPPGTGKTSLCTAIASKFNMPLYYLSLNSIDSDTALISTLNKMPERSILVIEDVDCANSESRSVSESNNKSGVSTSGLLNALDGILAPQGRLLIMTTNHYEKLDPALVRPGRADTRITLAPLSDDLAKTMISKIAPNLDVSEVDFAGKTGAEIEAGIKEILASDTTRNGG